MGINKVVKTKQCKCCNHWIWIEESVTIGLGPVCRSNIIFSKTIQLIELKKGVILSQLKKKGVLK